MKSEELDILQRPDVQDTIRRNLDKDPARLALTLKENAALISTQIKYLQRSRKKLPSYYEALCIIPPLSFEQSSSEATAAVKNHSGATCIDLTCGLGVDSFYLSRRFDKVVAVEQQPVLAETARINFSRLWAPHIEVVCDTAEHFLQQYLDLGKTVDLIYLDPARRSETGARVYGLEDCSPNVVELLPVLQQVARKIVIKISPLFDVEEAFRLFGPDITVEVVSVQGECKEVLIEIGAQAGGRIKTTRAGSGSLVFRREAGAGKAMYRLVSEGAETSEKSPSLSLPQTEPLPLTSYKYLLIPEVTLYKARLTETYARMLPVYCPSANGYFFGMQVPDDFFGQSFPIEAILPYKPKQLKAFFKTNGLLRSNFLLRDFPYTVKQISDATGLREGGNRYTAFTRIGTELYVILLADADA